MLLVVLMLLTGQTTQPLRWASPMQREAFAAGPTPMVMSGGWGSGKTYVGCMKALRLSDAYPGNRGVIFRKVGKELRATTMATFFKLCPQSAYAAGKRNDQDGLLKLNNGSEILFLHLENPDIQGIIRGLEINWFFGDQAEENPEGMEEIFDLLLGRLSRWDQAVVPQALIDAHTAKTGRGWDYLAPVSGKPVPPPYAMLACNPDTELHWIYRRFHPESVDWQKTYRPQGYQMFHMPSMENIFLSDANKAALWAHDDAFVKRNVLGEWGYAEGTIHAIPAESLVDGTPEILDYLRQRCTLHRVLDHGDSAATVCLWMACDDQGNVFFYREYYLPNALISTHRQNITALSEYETYEFNLADPSIFFKNSQKNGGRWSVADEYSDQREHPATTALYWSPADNNELGTRNRINEYLRVDPDRVHPFTKTKGAPRLFFIRATAEYPQGCQHAISQTRSQRRVKVGTDLGRSVFSDERDDTVTDHAYDCLSGDTTVRTREGWVPIASLVGTVGEVWTLAGWQLYTHCERYGVNKAMVRVRTPYGFVTCTPDHQFLTARGWVRADSLLIDDRIAQCIHLTPSASATPSKSSKGCATTVAGSISSGTGDGFIGPSGNLFMVLSRPDTTFTMSMKTGTITSSATWNASSVVPISVNTAANKTTALGSEPCETVPRSGTAAKTAAPGIGSITSRPWRTRIFETCESVARSVAWNFWRLVVPHLAPSFAVTTASRLGFVNTIRVTSVDSAARADSYCLSVPAPHAFAVNGGFLVHNCARYGIASRPPLFVSPGQKAGPMSFFGAKQRLAQQQARYAEGARR